MGIFLNQVPKLGPSIDWKGLYNAKRPAKPGGAIDIAAKKITPFIANHESFRDTAYKPVPSDPWTIGFGSTTVNGVPVKSGQKISRQQAQQLLENRIKSDAKQIQGMVKQPLKPNQLAALISFTYNAGTGGLKKSDLLKHLNNGDFAAAAKEFPKWVHDNAGNRLQGLVTRRATEQKLFNGGFAAIGR